MFTYRVVAFVASGFIAFWIIIATACFVLVGRYKFKKQGRVQGIARVEHFTIPQVVNHNWERELQEVTAKKLELAAVLYNAFQIIFFTLSTTASIWTARNTNHFLEFVVYFTRALCLDIPADAMEPLFVLLIIFMILFQFLSLLRKVTSPGRGAMCRSFHNMTTSLTTSKGFGPEVRNFFYWSMFLVFSRFTFRIISCAHASPYSSHTWLVSSYFGDYSCWDSQNRLPLLIIIICINIVYVLLSVKWNATRYQENPAYYSSPRYQVAVILLEYLMALSLVSFVTYPIGSAVTVSFITLFLSLYTFCFPPYLPTSTAAVRINSVIISSYITSFYLSLVTACTLAVNKEGSGLYIVGVVPIFIFFYLFMIWYLRTFKSLFFSCTNDSFIRELFHYIMHNELTEQCCTFLVQICKDPKVEKRAVHIVQHLSVYDYQELLSWTSERIPLLVWWQKWKVIHSEREATLEMVKYKIEKKSKVPRLVDLACLAVLQHGLKWEEPGILPLDLENHLHNLLQLDMAAIENRKWQRRKIRHEALRSAQLRGDLQLAINVSDETDSDSEDYEEENENEENGEVILDVA